MAIKRTKEYRVIEAASALFDAYEADPENFPEVHKLLTPVTAAHAQAYFRVMLRGILDRQIRNSFDG